MMRFIDNYLNEQSGKENYYHVSKDVQDKVESEHIERARKIFDDIIDNNPDPTNTLFYKERNARRLYSYAILLALKPENETKNDIDFVQDNIFYIHGDAKKIQKLYQNLELSLEIKNKNDNKEPISGEDEPDTIFDSDDHSDFNISHNQILYGPPGTGKTYNTVVKAMSIIDNVEYEYNQDGDYYYDKKDGDKKEITTYKKLKDRFQVELKEKSNDEIKPSIEDYIRWYEQNKFQKRKENPESDTIKSYTYELEKWKQRGLDLLNITSDEELEDYRRKLFKTMDDMKIKERTWITTLTNNYIEFYNSWKSKGITDKKIEFITFHQSYSYEEFVEGIKPYIPKSVWNADNVDNIKLEDVKYIGKKGIFREICKRAKEDKEKKPYVLIIDEINRGNISKIFGELITLIEEDKRKGADNELSVTLPYSGELFSVPNNLYIIGTMNTADRSIAMLDTALRRRFDFEEMPPKPELLENKKYGDIDYQKLLTNLNKNIREKGKLDKDHEIGHAFLINADNDENKLKRAFLNKIYPLLEEYFYGEEDTIQKVLNCKGTNYLKDVKTNWKAILQRLCNEDDNND